jgi:hypothetical protein
VVLALFNHQCCCARAANTLAVSPLTAACCAACVAVVCAPARSALSLAGFCALLRHLPRLTAGILEARAAGATSKQVRQAADAVVRDSQWLTIRAITAAAGLCAPLLQLVTRLMSACLPAVLSVLCRSWACCSRGAPAWLQAWPCSAP